jgi:hypothetical protein
VVAAHPDIMHSIIAKATMAKFRRLLNPSGNQIS